MRLIDADELINRIKENPFVSVTPALIQSIKDMPTAYDVDKVVEQLDSYCKEEDEKGCYIPERIQMKVEDIVKAGDVNV